MSLLIKGMDMPKTAFECSTKINPEERKCNYTGKIFEETLSLLTERRCKDCPLVEIPTPHGRLIDADDLRQKMYHKAFETESNMQKWDSGCWIRYKMFEEAETNARTIIEAED